VVSVACSPFGRALGCAVSNTGPHITACVRLWNEMGQLRSVVTGCICCRPVADAPTAAIDTDVILGAEGGYSQIVGWLGFG
jgi:hypothetical protein